jgi:hypothetical protein
LVLPEPCSSGVDNSTPYYRYRYRLKENYRYTVPVCYNLRYEFYKITFITILKLIKVTPSNAGVKFLTELCAAPAPVHLLETGGKKFRLRLLMKMLRLSYSTGTRYFQSYCGQSLHLVFIPVRVLLGHIWYSIWSAGGLVPSSGIWTPASAQRS